MILIKPENTSKITEGFIILVPPFYHFVFELFIIYFAKEYPNVLNLITMKKSRFNLRFIKHALLLFNFYNIILLIIYFFSVVKGSTSCPVFKSITLVELEGTGIDLLFGGCFFFSTHSSSKSND